LLKRKMDRVEALRRKRIERLMQDMNLNYINISDEDIIHEFKDAAPVLTWKKALHSVGLKNGLVDESGRPVNQWAQLLVARTRKAHSRARRDHLDDLRWREHMTPELDANTRQHEDSHQGKNPQRASSRPIGVGPSLETRGFLRQREFAES
jgi:hypothetical protein